MRKSFVAAIAIALATVNPVTGQDDPTAEKYQVIASQLVTQGDAALSTGELDAAHDLYERALVANPGSLAAYRGLGQVYEGMERTGRGLRFYRKALEIEPNDLKSLELQALAFLKKDLIDRASLNRSRLARLCKDGCGELEKVETAIERWHMKDDVMDKVAENAG